MKLTRRDLGKLAVAAIPGAELFNALHAQTLPAPELFYALRAQGGTKPNSKFAGVQIGMNVPYNYGGRDMNPDEVLDRTLKLNISAVEMRSQPVETFLGSPAANGQKAEADVMRKWRSTVSMDRVAAFRKKYEDAGVLIDIVKYDGIYTMSDEEVNYCFMLARTLGARASRARSTPSTPSASASSPTSTSCQSPIMAMPRRRQSIGRRRSNRPATTGRTSISDTSSPATTRRRCPSSSSTTRASRTCT